MSRWLILDAGILIESVILLRGLRSKLFAKYGFFHAYIAASLLGSLILLWVHLRSPSVYEMWYWPVQLATLVAGYGILLEILNHVLGPYPGAERFARFSGIAVFVVILCFALIAPRIMPSRSAGTVIEFERDVRSVQAVFVAGLLGVIFYYGIAVGRNMKGMMMGYGLYILTSLASLAVQAYAGLAFEKVWRVVQPLSLDASLVIWLLGLWSYCPNPVPDTTIRLEEDYEALVARTRSAVGAIRTYLGKAART